MFIEKAFQNACFVELSETYFFTEIFAKGIDFFIF